MPGAPARLSRAACQGGERLSPRRPPRAPAPSRRRVPPSPPVSRRPRLPLGGGHRLSARGAPSRPRRASPPLFLPLRRRCGRVPAPPSCSADPGPAGVSEPGLPAPFPPGLREMPRRGVGGGGEGAASGCEEKLCASPVEGGVGGCGGRGRGEGGGKTTTQNCLHEFPSARPASEISPIRAVRGGSQLTFPHHFTVTFGRQARWSAQTRN